MSHCTIDLSLRVWDVDMQKKLVRSLLIYTVILPLVLSGIIAIYLLLFGKYINHKIFLTTLCFGGYGILTLCNALLYEKNKNQNIFVLGLLLTLLGIGLSLLLIWVDTLHYQELLFKSFAISLILSFSDSHIALLLLLDRKHASAKYIIYATLFVIVCLAFMLIYNILRDTSDFYVRILGSLIVLDVLGTILCPIVAKMSNRP